MRTINSEGLAIIKDAEGLRLESYPDGRVWAVGYGSTFIDNTPVREDLTITEEQAEEYLLADLTTAESAVSRYVKVSLTDNQFSALASFTQNMGSGNFRESTLLKKLNSGDHAGAADQFDRWVYSSGKVSNGLIKRRAREKELFLS